MKEIAMKKKEDKRSAASGNLLMLGTLSVTLIFPLALIILSYLNIIEGIAMYIAAMAVIFSAVYIIIGSTWMFWQDSKDVDL